MKRISPLFLLLLLCSPAIGQKIYVEHHGNDAVGNQFMFAFKEAARRSASFEVVDAEDNALQVHIYSMDRALTSEPENIVSAVFVQATLDPKVSDCVACHWVVYQNFWIIGKDRTDQLALNVLAGLDKKLSEWRSLFTKMLDNAKLEPTKETKEPPK